MAQTQQMSGDNKTKTEQTRQKGQQGKQGQSTGGKQVGTRVDGGGQVHEHRTAKVIELVGTSTTSFDDAIQNALSDARETVKGIHGAEITSQTVKCENGQIIEYKAAMKVAFGVKHSEHP